MKSLILIYFFSFSILFANENWIKLDTKEEVKTKEKKSFSPSDIGILNLFEGISDPKKALNKMLKKDLNKNNKISKNHKIKKTYYTNGKMKTSSSYLEDKKDGLENEYYTNGKLMVTTYYYKGKKHGVQTIYSQDGRVHKSYFFRDGLKQKD